MLDKTKTDKKLGIEVNHFLDAHNVNTPNMGNTIKIEEKMLIIEACFKTIMESLDLDLADDSLKETPKRVSKMFLNELCWGLFTDNFPKCTTVQNKMGYNEMVLEKNIKVSSLCEHHFVTIWGKAHIAYIPNKKVLGLSKINRIVEYFSRRPQIQERLSSQIFYALEYILGTNDIGVVINAEHFCVKTRGVEDVNSNTITSKLGGKFMKESGLRHEFMTLIGGK